MRTFRPTFYRFPIVAVLTALSLTVACDSDSESTDSGDATTTGEGGSSETAEPAVDYATQIQPIWTERCTPTCHEPSGTWSPLNLTEGASYDQLLMGKSTQSSLAFIKPGDPDASYLWHKVNGTQLDAPGGGSGERMPNGEGAAPLTQAQLDLIEAWINAGAPE